MGSAEADTSGVKLNDVQKSWLLSPDTMQCAVYAMANFPSLKNVLIIPRSPRTDEELLAHVSEYGNNMLVSEIASIGVSSIKLESMESIPCKTVSEKSDLFRSRHNILKKNCTHIQIWISGYSNLNIGIFKFEYWDIQIWILGYSNLNIGIFKREYENDAV